MKKQIRYYGNNKKKPGHAYLDCELSALVISRLFKFFKNVDNTKTKSTPQLVSQKVFLFLYC
jgi:hypothetical protein